MILKSKIISKPFFFLNLDMWVCTVAWSMMSAVYNVIRDMRKCLYFHLGIWLVFWPLTNIGVIELFLPHHSKEKAVVDLYAINLRDDPSWICTLVIHTYTKRYFTLSVILWRYTELCGLFHLPFLMFQVVSIQNLLIFKEFRSEPGIMKCQSHLS